LKKPTVVPSTIALEAQRACPAIRSYWKERNNDSLHSVVNQANMRIRAETQTAGYASKDMGGGGKLDKFTISAPGIITSVDSILAWSQTWGDCRRAKDKNGQKAASTMVTQECLALIKVLDKSGLGWKSVVPPEVKKHVEDVIGSGTQTMDPDLLGVLTSFMARDDQACQYQSSIVEEKKEKFTEFYNAVTKADKPAATKALADVTALNTTLAKANKEVGFKETDHLIPVDKMKILMSRPIWDVSSKPKRRAKEIDVNKHGLASYFTEFGFTKTGGLLSASISNTKNVTDASSGTWIVQKRREFEEPLALGWHQSPSASSGSTPEISSELLSPLFEPTESDSELVPSTVGQLKLAIGPRAASADTSMGGTTDDAGSADTAMDDANDDAGSPGLTEGPMAGTQDATSISNSSTLANSIGSVQARPIADTQDATSSSNSSTLANSVESVQVRPIAGTQDASSILNASTLANSVKSVQAKGGPPKTTSIPGPSFVDGITDFGKVIGVRAVGGALRGYRAIVNVGTDRCEIFECMARSVFGRHMGKTLYDQKQLPLPVNISGRTPEHIAEISAIAMIRQSPDSTTRSPITYFRVAWRRDTEYPGPAVEWITRSDAISICGKKRVDDAVLGYRAQLLDLRNTMQEWINECKTKGLDPDTGDPITDVRRLELRWLFPPATVGIAKDEGGRKRQPLADEVHHIKVGTGWSPPSQRRQEASREDRSSPGPRQRTYDSTPEASSSSGGRHLVRRGQK